MELPLRFLDSRKINDPKTGGSRSVINLDYGHENQRQNTDAGMLGHCLSFRSLIFLDSRKIKGRTVGRINSRISGRIKKEIKENQGRTWMAGNEGNLPPNLPRILPLIFLESRHLPDFP